MTRRAKQVPVDDDDPPPKKPPRFCPWCGGEVLKRWTPNKLFSLHRVPSVKTAHVCLTCKVAVRAFQFPPRPLFVSKKEARAEARRAYDDLEASGFQSVFTREAYRRGKCTCSGHPFMSLEPCPRHRPLRTSA